MTIGITLLSGCQKDDTQEAMAVVESFHKQFSTKKFEIMYAETVSTGFKKSMTKDDYFAMMNKNLSVLGKYEFGRLLKFEQVQVLIGTNKIKISYHSNYINYELNELFVLQKEDGKYKINQIVYDDISIRKLKN